MKSETLCFNRCPDANRTPRIISVFENGDVTRARFSHGPRDLPAIDCRAISVRVSGTKERYAPGDAIDDRRMRPLDAIHLIRTRD